MEVVSTGCKMDWSSIHWQLGITLERSRATKRLSSSDNAGVDQFLYLRTHGGVLQMLFCSTITSNVHENVRKINRFAWMNSYRLCT